MVTEATVPDDLVDIVVPGVFVRGAMASHDVAARDGTGTGGGEMKKRTKLGWIIKTRTKWKLPDKIK